jgi:glutamate N-acetyltransferase / amino-acid N-acetyltransferase
VSALPVSPLAPERFPELPAVAGVRLATRAAWAATSDRTDVLVAELARAPRSPGTFTRSLCPSAPVDWCRRSCPGEARALVCNSGNANAFTGARAPPPPPMRTAVAASLGVAAGQVFLASTGVIGETLPDELLARELPGVVDGLADADAVTWAAAADAIRTTDTFAKGPSRAVRAPTPWSSASPRAAA